ncbi:cytochrome P450 family protein [Actinomadura macrotermitis]|uniref:Cytochrome P450 107B1 n=1 Tax=Actinomadura macrotermitis TaxID=2585200 RepID=A0A7K0BUE5_9ACTN|nr:cytochrome P450 [Actinomadura macrotermitis]MQY04771.1 Cytochrome P450 107B1 [Actinomadura macrotermitis]
MTPDADAFFADPYAFYASWREAGGAYRVTLPGGLAGWVVTGHAEARAALADPRLRKDGANQRYLRRLGAEMPAPGGGLSAHMLNSDPPDHTRLRKLVQKGFTARRVQQLRPRVEEIATALLDEMDGRDEADLVESYALPLPMTVICELLGVPLADRAHFESRSRKMLAGEGSREEFFAALKESADYLKGLVAAKRAEPAGDLLSALVQARDDGDALSEQEVIAMVFLLMVAGHETTVNLIAGGVQALLRHPDQLAALRADPALLPGAIEEFLRYESPVNIATLRYTGEPVTIGGTEIPEGEFVHVALPGANRDPAVFAEPDRLDITRADAAAHLAFGHGVHHCLGAPLARLEAEVAFTLLLARFPGLREAEPGTEPAWQPNVRFRGLTALPVRLR